jgi:hypothetical protein
MQMEKWLLELEVLALMYEVVDHKSLQTKLEILKELTWVCIMVFHSRSFPIPTIFILPNNFIPYYLLMDNCGNL